MRRLYFVKGYNVSDGVCPSSCPSSGYFIITHVEQYIPPQKKKTYMNITIGGLVLNRLVPFHIIEVRTKRSFILLIREGKTTCSTPWCHSINSDASPVSSQLVSSKQPTVAGVNYHNRI